MHHHREHRSSDLWIHREARLPSCNTFLLQQVGSSTFFIIKIGFTVRAKVNERFVITSSNLILNYIKHLPTSAILFSMQRFLCFHISIYLGLSLHKITSTKQSC